MRPNKAETTVLGDHCPGDMAVRMRKVLVRPWVGLRVCHLLLLLFLCCFVAWSDHVYLIIIIIIIIITIIIRHLSTKCRSILSADMATDTRPIYRPTLGRYVSVDMCDMCRSTCVICVGRHEPTSMSADTRPILHCHSAATWPILYQHSVNTTLTWSALGTKC